MTPLVPASARRTAPTPRRSCRVDHVVMPAVRFSVERIRERKSYAFRLYNQRRGQVAVARRRVDAARAALGQPSLALVEERQVIATELRASKRPSLQPIASAITAA